MVFYDCHREIRNFEETKITILQNLLCDEGVPIFNMLKFEDTTEDTVSKFYIVEKNFKITVLCKNVVFEHYKFFTCIKLGQSVDVYLTQLNTSPSSCKFTDQEESLICDRIILGVKDKSLQERLRELQLSLKKKLQNLSGIRS